MRTFPLIFKVWTRNRRQLELLLEAVERYNGGREARVEKQERSAGDVWVTLAATDAGQAFGLGRHFERLLQEEGGLNYDDEQAGMHPDDQDEEHEQ